MNKDNIDYYVEKIHNGISSGASQDQKGTAKISLKRFLDFSCVALNAVVYSTLRVLSRFGSFCSGGS